MAEVIAIANQKGGVGKTMTSVSLSACLALHDKKVLLVDLDPQGHSTKAFGYYDSSQYPLSMRDVILSVIQDIPIDKEQLILHSDENVDIVPSNISLASINATLESAMCRETVVKRFIDTVREDYDFIVIDVLDDSPAQKADIEVGDVITEIDSKSVIGLTLDDISSLIKGKAGSKVKLTLLRGEEILEKTVTRGNVELVSVISNVYNDDIGYIYIQNFAANTYQQFKKELNSLEKKNIQSLIIDVRSNPGGHLSQTRDILELFMDKNKVLYQVEFKGDKERIKDETSTSRSYPIAVLVNSASASASEILAASFQDSYSDAILVGETTYGKGTVQQAFSLSDGSSLKYTTERWLTPKGKWIDGKGIRPDYEVSLPDDYLQNPTEDNDLQLQKAIELLSKD